MSVNSAQQFLNVRDSHLRVVSGNVHADQMVLGGITVDTSHGLQSITNTSNVTTNTVEFSNATTAFVTTANVEVGGELTVTGNATVSSNLTVTGNAVTENLLVSNNLTVTGNAVTENLLVSNNLTVTGNTFYTNPAAVLVDSNVVTEYTGPHDRPLRKYPEIILPRAAVGAEYNGYRIDRSSEHVTATYDGVHDLFNETAVDYTDTWGAGWQGTSGAYSTSTGEHTAYVTGGTTQGTAARLASNVPNGEWVSLQVSTPIKLDNVEIRSRNVSSGGETQFPKDFEFWGSDDGTTWYHIKSFTGVTSSGISVLHKYNVNSTTLYNRFALVVTKIPGETSSGANDGAAHFSISELRFNGYEEGSGSLDTTLKTVYNVPATTGTQLEVYYDGRDYTQASDFTGTGGVVDKAGGDQDGTAGTGVTFDTTYKAFVFDASGSGTVTTSKITSSTLPSTFVDNAYHSVAMWFKLDTITGEHTLFTIKDNTNGFSYQTPHVVIDEGILRYDFWSNNIQLLDQIVANEWYHLVITFSGGNHQSGTKFYINGVHNTNVSTPSGTDNLDIQVNSVVYLGGSISSYERGIDGSIANFRLYSKALNAGQVQELYDYQKDYFLGSKSQVTLYKGHLGVGVTEPSGQLELAGDERIQEYPPRGMTGYSTHIEGHGVFEVSASTVRNSSWEAWEAFDGRIDINSRWISADTYTGTEDAYNGTARLYSSAPLGEYVILKLPYSIKLSSARVYGLSGSPDDNNNRQGPERGQIWGSNDGVTWEHVTNYDFGDYQQDQWNEINNINSMKYYSQYGFITTKKLNNTYTASGAGQGDYVAITEIQYFGTPGPTTLDKGSLSLTRSLDVPRVSRYDVDTETPRPEKLVVDFDTTVNSSPTDISGEGNHGVFYGATYSPADKAFNFDGTDDYIEAATNLGSGNQTLCFSMWLKPETDSRWFIDLGKNTATGGSFFAIRYDTYYQFNVKNGNHLQITAGSLNTWEHLVIIYHGTGSTKTAGTIEGYVNGVPGNIIDSDFADDQLSLSANPPIEIGARTGASNTYFDGQISNFKLYNVALEPSEVQKLYRLGRTGRSMVISDTAVGIGKVPEAQLDVRGIGMFQRVGIGMNNMPLGEKNDTTRRSTIPTLTMYNEMEDSSGGPTIRMQSNHGKWDLMANENTDHSFDFDFNETNVGYLRSASYNDKDMNNFTGQHRTFIKDVPFSQVGELEGLIVSSDQNKYIKMSGGIEVGSNAITTNESLPVVSLSNVVTDKKCFGVISASEDPEKREEMYGNFGSVFEKEKGDTRVYINSVGEGAIWVTDINGSLESGDYITTSNVAGYGQKQNGAGLMNYTVAKITMDCDFEPVTQSVQIIKKDEHGENVLDEHGQIQWEDHPTETEKAYKIRYLDAIGNITDEANHVYKAAFVGCTYHCG